MTESQDDLWYDALKDTRTSLIIHKVLSYSRQKSDPPQIHPPTRDLFETEKPALNGTVSFKHNL